MSKFQIADFTKDVKNKAASCEEVTLAMKQGGFGDVFSEHMAVISYNKERGWYDPKIIALGDFAINPFNATLQYAQTIFEGLKAYWHEGRGAVLFRPYSHAQRFQNSAKRMSMPVLDNELFVKAIAELVKIDSNWIPRQEGASLYLRPFMFVSDNFLGVRLADNYRFCVITSPVQDYFRSGAKGLHLWLEEEYARCGPGGTGAVKCGGNYAASFYALQRAMAAQCDQVLFLDSVEHKWIEELGGMNIFFITADNSFITPQLNGRILPGITRDCILTLAKAMGYKTEERPISFAEVEASVKSGEIKEAFACGTAASVAPIARITHKNGELSFGADNSYKISMEMRAALQGIQNGSRPDEYSWLYYV